jgi:hypothetical protein
MDQAQRAGVPPNNRQIPTPRGSVESWLPLHHLASIYQAGSEFAMGKPGAFAHSAKFGSGHCHALCQNEF